MEHSQSEPIVQAVIEPDAQSQERLRQKRATEAWWLSAKRLVAVGILVGFALGAVVAYFIGERLSAGGLKGGLVGAGVGWLVVGWHHWRRAA